MAACPYCKDNPCNSDCAEQMYIFRERQKEMLADIDLEDMVDCMDCGCPIDKPYTLCYSCEHGLKEDY